MLNFKSLSKILLNILKVIVYAFLILFSFICIIALYQIYTEKDGFNRGMALIFLIVFSVFLSLTMCNLLKTFLLLCSKKVNITEKLFERKYFKSLDKFEFILKIVMKIILRVLAYLFVFFLIGINIVSVADENARDRGTFPLEAIQFLTVAALIALLIMLFKDLKTISALGSAAVGQAKLSALGRTPREIRTTLQPIAIDLHMLQNPWANYNVYLSTVMVPGLLMLFVFLLTPYSLGIEIKFQRSREWLALAGNRAWVALVGKLLPQFMVSRLIFYAFEFYIYYVQDFPHAGGLLPILLCGILSLLAAQGFGIFIFGLMPGLRMAMSVCSLWSVVSLSIAGATFPIFAMNPMLEAVAVLFPLRHYYMIYQLCVFNGFPMLVAWPHLLALLLFCFLPFVSLWNIKRAMLLYTYLP